MLRYSLATLAAVIVCLSIYSAALAQGDGLWPQISVTLTVSILLFATLAIFAWPPDQLPWLSEKLPPKRVLGDVELLIGRIGLGDEKVERGADENVGGPAMRDDVHVSYFG